MINLTKYFNKNIDKNVNENFNTKEITNDNNIKILLNEKSINEQNCNDTIIKQLDNMNSKIGFFNKKIFYSAIIDNLNNIQNEIINMNQLIENNLNSNNSMINNLIISINEKYQSLERKIIELNIPQYLMEIERSYMKGYYYHKKEVELDNELFNWVIKEDYLS